MRSQMVRENGSAIDLIRLVRDNGPSGLLTDIDGTISHIAGHPDAATVEPRARNALALLSGQFELVGAVSGRSANDAREIVGLDSLVYSGNHGMEIWRDGRIEKSPMALRYVPIITEMLQRLQIVHEVPELFVENKGLTASIHYRGVTDPEKVELDLIAEVKELASDHDLRVTRGQMVVEIRPPVELSKGTSVLALIDEYELCSLMYIGDDITDVDAFHALRSRREEQGQHFYSVGVMEERTPEPVLENADALVTGVEGVIALLSAGAEK
jgi:trehalose 6-phosphate phosphatase